MPPPPYEQIKPPWPYELWKEKKELYPDGTKVTRTVAYDHPDTDGMRVVWGQTNPKAFWFHIEMTPAQEIEFWTIYGTWHAKADNAKNTHEFASSATKPKDCGTPTTPPCPPPSALDSAIGDLAQLAAGPGAPEPQIEVKRSQITQMLVNLVKSTIKLFGG